MAGVKGRSGRKSRYQEIQEGKLENLAHSWAVENWGTFDHATKLKLTLAITPKMVTQKTELKASVDADEVKRMVAEAVRLEMSMLDRPEHREVVMAIGQEVKLDSVNEGGDNVQG